MRNKRDYVILLIILILYHVIAFASPFDRGVEFWISYACGGIAIIFGFLSIKHAYAGNKRLESKVFRLPIIYICIISTLLQVTISISFMAIGKGLLLWIEIIIFAIIMAVVSISWIVSVEAVDAIENVQKKSYEDTTFIPSLEIQVKMICDSCDEDCKKKLFDLAELIRYSDPVSNIEIKEIEMQIQNEINKLEKDVKAGGISDIDAEIEIITNFINKRNAMCRLSK